MKLKSATTYRLVPSLSKLLLGVCLAVAFPLGASAGATANDGYDLFEVDADTSVFAPANESFVGILVDTSEKLDGDVDELFSDRNFEFRKMIVNMESFTLQSQTPLTRTRLGGVEIVKARILLKREQKIYVINEEHRFLGKRSYALVTFSELNKEHSSRATVERIAATFTANTDEASASSSLRKWWVAALLPSAHARESVGSSGSAGRARSGNQTRVPPAGPSRQRDPRCMNVGIEDRNDIRFLNEPRPSMTSFANASDCGAGGVEAWNSLVASLTGPSNWLVAAGIDEDQQRLMRLTPMAGAGIDVVKSLEGIYGLVASIGSTVADKKLGVFSYLLQEVRNDDRRTNCMTNAAQMRQVCRRLTMIAPAIAARRPIGVAARGSARVAANSLRAPVRAARERIGVLAGRTTLQRTTTQLTNGRVIVRDGGFRGSVVNSPPGPGNYVIVNNRYRRNGQMNDRLTLIQSSDGVGPGATLRRIKADNQDYYPGHRSSVGDVTIGPQGEVTLRPHPSSAAGDLDVIKQQLRSLGIRPK